MKVMLLVQAPVLAYPLSSVIKPDLARSCEMSTATSASVPTTVGNSKLLLSYVRVAFFVMGASDAWAYSTLGAMQKCECDDTVARGERTIVFASRRCKESACNL